MKQKENSNNPRKQENKVTMTRESKNKIGKPQAKPSDNKKANKQAG